MKIQTIVPCKFDFDNESIICEIIPHCNHLRKTNNRNNSPKYISFSIHEKKQSNTIENLIFQYKVGRCGSNLLSNMLECDNIWKVVSEPILFNSILRSSLPDKKVKMYLDKLIELYTIKENEHQQYCYIDFSSQTILQKDKIDKFFPKITQFYLYRQPAEVAQSLNKRTPMWMKEYSSAFDYLQKMCHIVKDIKVHYYRNILSMHIIDWLYNVVNEKLSEDVYLKMKKQLDIHTTNIDTSSQDNEELLPNQEEQYKEYFYNKTFINFYLKNPPYQYLEENTKQIETIDWGKHKDFALHKIQKRLQPLIVQNSKIEFDLQREILKGRKSLNVQYAVKENSFMWKQKEGFLTYEQWKQSPDAYIVSGAKIDPKKYEILNHFAPEDKNVGFRMSHCGAMTLEHIDMHDTMLFVGQGKKTMYLLEESIGIDLGVYPVGHKLSRRLVNNLIYLNTHKYKIDKEKIWWGEINPGELIFFPAGWAHLTITQEDNTYSINLRKNVGKSRKPFNILNHQTIKEIEDDMHPYLRKSI